MEKEKTNTKRANKEFKSKKGVKQALSAKNQKKFSESIKERSRIYPGQSVHSADRYLVGTVTKLLTDAENNTTHIIVPTRRIFQMNKVVPIDFIDQVDTDDIRLSISRGMYNALRNYREDAAIADEIDRALWADPVLRSGDYHHIDIQVRDGTIFLSGHVITKMSLARVEAAVQRVEGVLGIMNRLVSDDELVRDVAGALGRLEKRYGMKFFTRAENGVIHLRGEASSALERKLAEKCAACRPGVRGVVNFVRAPGVDLDAEDHRFLQPAIGQQISFQDGKLGNVIGVAIDPDNRRVSHLVLRGRFVERKQPFLLENDDFSNSEQIVVIPINAVQYLNQYAGRLTMSGAEAVRSQTEYLPAFTIPPVDWVPPYPYQPGDVLLFHSGQPTLAHLPETSPQWIRNVSVAINEGV